MDKICSAQTRRTQSSNTLVIDCKDCDRTGILANSECLSNVLGLYMSEYNIDSIVLSGYIERQYSGNTIKLLEMMCSLAEAMDQLGTRNPVKEHFLDGEKSDDPGCGTCDINPQNVFAQLRTQLVSDISEFYRAFVHFAQSVERGREARCSQCLFHTGNDLVYLHNEMDTLRRYIIHEGFGIVLE